MRTVKPLNLAESVRVGREGDKLTIELKFTDGTTKTAEVSTAELVALERGKILANAPFKLGISRRKFTHHPPKQRPIDALYIGIGGGGPDLAIVSRAAFFEAAGLQR